MLPIIPRQLVWRLKPMSNGINLIEKQADKNVRSELTGRIKKFSFVLVFSVGLLSILFFLLNYRFSLGYVKSEEDKLTKKMLSFEEVSSKVFLLNSRLADISYLLSSRKKPNVTSEVIINIKPENLAISKYQIDAGGVSIDASSPNLSDINDFLNSLLSLTEKKKISSITINSLGADVSGYSVGLLIN